MANYTILFNDLKGDYSLSCKHDVYDNENASINIEISGKEDSFIMLDISTAIKFAKTLRTEINKAKELESEISKQKSSFHIKPTVKLPKI